MSIYVVMMYNNCSFVRGQTNNILLLLVSIHFVIEYKVYYYCLLLWLLVTAEVVAK
jgi:hypothetical protein